MVFLAPFLWGLGASVAFGGVIAGATALKRWWTGEDTVEGFTQAVAAINEINTRLAKGQIAGGVAAERAAGMKTAQSIAPLESLSRSLEDPYVLERLTQALGGEGQTGGAQPTIPPEESPSEMSLITDLGLMEPGSGPTRGFISPLTAGYLAQASKDYSRLPPVIPPTGV